MKHLLYFESPAHIGETVNHESAGSGFGWGRVEEAARWACGGTDRLASLRHRKVLRCGWTLHLGRAVSIEEEALGRAAYW